MIIKLAGDSRPLEECAITHICEVGTVVFNGFDDEPEP